MIQSMTGYGNTTSGKGSNRFTISIKTVNARFLDIKFKGCDLEPNVEKEILALAPWAWALARIPTGPGS